MKIIRIALALVVLVSLLGAGIAIADPGLIGQGNDDSIPPEKLAVLEQQAAEQAALDAGYHAPKDKPPMTPSTSCPIDLKDFSSEIAPVRFESSSNRNLVNVTSLVVDGRPLVIYAGSAANDVSQGLIVVEHVAKDPCASAADTAPTSRTEAYGTPEKAGRLTLTKVLDTSVGFQTDTGTEGSFDVNSKSFVVDGHSENPLTQPAPLEPSEPVQ